MEVEKCSDHCSLSPTRYSTVLQINPACLSASYAAILCFLSPWATICGSVSLVLCCLEASVKGLAGSFCVSVLLALAPGAAPGGDTCSPPRTLPDTGSPS